MKKIVYLAPLALLSIGAKASANQVPTHISNALRIYEQENKTIGQNESEQGTQQAKPSLPNGQNKPVGKVEEATHISRLDSGLINEDSSVVNRQASQVMKISRTAIPTKQELNESKDSVAGQYVQVQQNRVAQFNNGSKIYGLNNSNQLNKNNGAGYVITNAGTYNGRAVDIGVTVNNINDNQGSYTTKWSNGDKADVTGKLDNQFNYQNSVLVGSKSVTPQLDQTRPRNKKQSENVDISGVWIAGYTDNWEEDGDTSYDRYANDVSIITPELLKQVMEQANAPVNEALAKFTENNFASKLVSCHANITDKTYVDKYFVGSPGYFSIGNTGAELPHVTRNFLYHVSFNKGVHASDLLTTDEVSTSQTYGQKILDTSLFEWPIVKNKNLPPLWANGDGGFSPAIDTMIIPDAKFDANEGYNSDLSWTSGFNNIHEYTDWSSATGPLHQKGIKTTGDFTAPNLATYKITPDPVSATLTKDVQVTDHLQPDQINQGSLNYNYTIGVYDAQTGELIKDLTANYKGKTGKTATEQDTAMNSAIKAKIQAINANTANSAYIGTTNSDDVTFSKNTVHVNYVDEQGQQINIPGYDIDVDNLTSGNYQVPQNYVLANTNGFKVTKNTHEVNGVTVTDSYNFIDQGHNKVTDNGKTLSVVLAHGTTHVNASHSGLSNNATANTFVINNGAKRQINSQSRHFGAAGVLDLVTNKITKQGDWLLLGKSNFDKTNINNNLVGYGNTIHSNLTFLAL